MKKLAISTTGMHGHGTGFLLPTSGGTQGGVCLEQVRPRRDDAVTTVWGSNAVVATDVQGAAPTVASTSPGPPASAPPIT